jgi:hypothetical protein
LAAALENRLISPANLQEKTELTKYGILFLHFLCLLRFKSAILSNDELKGPRGAGCRRMMELCAAGRAGTSDEVGNVGALLMGADGAFITGSDFLMDGGVTAAYWFGELAPK